MVDVEVVVRVRVRVQVHVRGCRAGSDGTGEEDQVVEVMRG